jgi:hypothetical protein
MERAGLVAPEHGNYGSRRHIEVLGKRVADLRIG